MRYLLVDTANTFFRARHSAHRQSDTWDRLGFALHVTLGSINKVWREQQADHVVFCLEGRSWRKDFYEPYKKNRAVARAALTEAEAEEDRLFWETFDALKTFIQEKTNCTVLHHPELEADDLIAGFIAHHPDDHHTIVSSDTDFHQLLADNVNQYNGISEELHTIQGIFDKKGQRVVDKRTGLAREIANPKYVLFEKCMRGDPTDNVFSAFPGVRSKSTKNKIGLEEAFADKDRRGYAWNNLLLQRWTDHLGQEHRVLDDYTRNVTLIDLTAQPPDIKQKISATIKAATPKNNPMVGAQFLKFCGKYELTRLSENATNYADWLCASYPQ